MTTERQQPTIAEVREALEACRGGPSSSGTWNERCANLRELLGRCGQAWRTPETMLLAMHCRRYLRDAGATL